MTAFPYEIKLLDPELNKELMSKFHGERTGFVEVGPKRWIMSAGYKQHAQNYFNFPLRSDDVWIVTYPRSGTTVTQEMVWMIMNDLDFERSAELDLVHRCPFIEFHCFQHEELIAQVREQNKGDNKLTQALDFVHKAGYEVLADMPSPRIIKTHLPLSLLPPDLIKTCKVVYTARNPKDVCESYFHHNKLIRFHDYVGDFDAYWDYFQKDLLMYSPFFEHVKEGWDVRNNPNVFFLFYEDLIKELERTIAKLSNFLNKPLTDKKIKELMKHLQIDNFRKKVHFIKPDIPGLTNGTSEKFVRKGQTGSNSLYSEDLLNRANTWIASEVKRTGIQFPI